MEDDKVIPRQKSALRGVCDTKEDGELRATDAREVARWRDRVHKLVTIQESAAVREQVQRRSFGDERATEGTYFSPLTVVLALASKVRRQRLSSDSCARTALLTDCTTREVARPSAESACTTGNGLVAEDMGRQLKTGNVFRVNGAKSVQELTVLVQWRLL